MKCFSNNGKQRHAEWKHVSVNWRVRSGSSLWGSEDRQENTHGGKIALDPTLQLRLCLLVSVLVLLSDHLCACVFGCSCTCTSCSGVWPTSTRLGSATGTSSPRTCCWTPRPPCSSSATSAGEAVEGLITWSNILYTPIIIYFILPSTLLYFHDWRF